MERCPRGVGARARRRAVLWRNGPGGTALWDGGLICVCSRRMLRRSEPQGAVPRGPSRPMGVARPRAARAARPRRYVSRFSCLPRFFPKISLYIGQYRTGRTEQRSEAPSVTTPRGLGVPYPPGCVSHSPMGRTDVVSRCRYIRSDIAPLRGHRQRSERTQAALSHCFGATTRLWHRAFASQPLHKSARGEHHSAIPTPGYGRPAPARPRRYAS